MASTPAEDLSAIKEAKAKILIQEQLALQKALTGTDVDAIYKAQSYVKNMQTQQKSNAKTVLLDPNDISSSMGYKNKGYDLSYDVLRGMARTHVIKSIIETRKEQISAFCQPQSDKYSTGFVIQRKEGYFIQKKKKKLSKAEENRIEELTKFLISCGSVDRFWHADTFDVFIKKVLNDSLIFDQGTFEVVYDRSGVPCEFFATDGATMRIADSFLAQPGDKDGSGFSSAVTPKFIKGYAPAYVQLMDGNIVNEYYPWQLGFCIRNPSTDIHQNGYGRSELEDMIQTVTAILNSDFYNSNFFKVGSAPKGILKYTGNINENTVQEFRSQWMTQVAGVTNMHKIPIVNADKLDFINMQQSNRDMEFSKYQEFLIKISCALYKIDPSEIGFPMSGSSDAKPMFEGNNEARLKYSKDKGLKPLLKQIERWVNKYIIWQLDPDYEFRFVGMDEEHTYKEELDNAIIRLTNFQTPNEIREEYNLPPVENGDTIINSGYLQLLQMQQQQEMQQQQMQGQNQSPEDQNNPFMQEGNEDQPQMQGGPGGDQEGQDEDNPFMKALSKDLERILTEGS